jgi:hypothetical protein
MAGSAGEHRPTKMKTRETTTVRELMVNCRRHEQMLDIPDQRLLYRRSVWNYDSQTDNPTLSSIPDGWTAWTAAWSALLPVI